MQNHNGLISTVNLLALIFQWDKKEAHSQFSLVRRTLLTHHSVEALPPSSNLDLLTIQMTQSDFNYGNLGRCIHTVKCTLMDTGTIVMGFHFKHAHRRLCRAHKQQVFVFSLGTYICVYIGMAAVMNICVIFIFCLQWICFDFYRHDCGHTSKTVVWFKKGIMSTMVKLPIGNSWIVHHPLFRFRS